MKSIGKKMIAGAIAASFVLGGSYVALSNSQAFAADTTTSGTSAATQQQGHGPGHMGRGGFGGGNLAKEAATVLGQQESDIQTSLQSGKTLLDIAKAAGLTEDDFLAKLVDAEKTNIASQVTAGKLTQDQADKIVSGLSDRLKQQIERIGPMGGPGRGGHGGHGGPGDFGGPMGNPDLLASILGITKDELRTQLDSGTSIADLAAAKGISEDDLISKIKDGMTDSIKNFVEAKHVKPANAPAATPSASSAAPTTNS
jgi:hypothetical protein